MNALTVQQPFAGLHFWKGQTYC